MSDMSRGDKYFPDTVNITNITQ
jgi:hypothetical protein